MRLSPYYILCSMILVFTEGCQTNDVASSLEAIGKKLNSLESYQAQIHSRILLSNGTWSDETGTMFFKKPDKEKWLAYSTNDSEDYRVMITGGKVEWSYGSLTNTAYKKIIISPKERGENFNRSILKSLEKGEVKYLGTRSFKDKKIEIYEFKKSLLIGKGARGKAVIGVGLEDRLPYLVEERNETDEIVARLEFSDYELNVPIPDSEFEFIPPPGAQVVDLSEGSKDVIDHGGGIKSYKTTIIGTGPPKEE